MLRRNTVIRMFAVAAAMAPLSCQDLSPFEPELTNRTDELQLQVSGVTPGVTGNSEMTWQNTGRLANVNQSSQLTGGSGTFTIRDSAGQLVYTGNLSQNGSFVSSTGSAGAWTIRVEASSLSGTVSIRIQRGS